MEMPRRRFPLGNGSDSNPPAAIWRRTIAPDNFGPRRIRVRIAGCPVGVYTRLRTEMADSMGGVP